MDKTRVDDMLIEMITPKVNEINEKFGNGGSLSQDDINTLLLKSQYNHINHLDQKLDEVVADVASLKGEFNGLKGEFNILRNDFIALEKRIDLKFQSFEERMNAFEQKMEARFEAFEEKMEKTIEKALNRNMMSLIAILGLFLTLSKLIDKLL